jgi:hypothetical protein
MVSRAARTSRSIARVVREPRVWRRKRSRAGSPEACLDAQGEPVQVFRMNLAIRALMNQIEELARARGFDRARVLHKVNRRGELVIGLLLPPRRLDEWGEPPPRSRDEKRASREKR